jgi:hypothetical protein
MEIRMKKKNLVLLSLSLLGSAAALPGVALAQNAPDSSYDGLTLVEGTKADLVYTLPDADFSVYDSFYIVEPMVAFRKNWQRDFNRSSAQRRVTEADMERIKAGMAELFLEVFTDELEDGGYSVVDDNGPNVMILRPAIIDLDVTAPDIPAAGRSQSFSTSAGSARIYIEFYDSVTGQILARAADFQRARDNGTFQWASSVTNRAEARRVLRRWTGMLIEALDEVHGK